MRYFTLAELTRTNSGLANVPAPAQVDALFALVAQVLDPLREHLGMPVHVTSGFRSWEVNRQVGGSAASQHPRGEAADIYVVGMSPADLARVIIDLHLPYDQLIWYEPGHGKPAVHVSHTTRRPNRGEVLRWCSEAPHYRKENP